MGLRFDPIGGGQFKNAVKQLIEIEKQPLKNIEARKTREEARIKLFQEFKSKFNNIERTLAQFSDFKKFRELKADLGEGEKLMSVTLDKERADTGSYEIQIDQLAKRTSVLSNSFADPEEPVLGIGFVIVYTPDGEKYEMYIDEDNASIKGVSKLLNNDPNCPIRASVVKDISNMDKPYKLIMTAKKDGYDDEVKFPDFYFLDGTDDFYLIDDREADNALIQIDGFEIEAESDDIVDFLEGVNIHLRAAREDEPFMMTITEDYKKITDKVKALVDQINGILEFINKQNQVDKKSDTRTTFTGDTGLQAIEYRLRNLMHEGFPYGDPEVDEEFRYVFMTEMGVQFDKNGMLSFNEGKFTKAMEDDFRAVGEGISGPYGFANQLRVVIDGYSRSGTGLLGMREKGMQQRLRRLDDENDRKERQIEQRTQAITAKFARLQASLSAMQQQQQYLASSLPGAGGGGNLVQQLLGG